MMTFHAAGEKWPQLNSGARARLEDLIDADVEEMSNEADEKFNWNRVVEKIQELDGYDFLRTKPKCKPVAR